MRRLTEVRSFVFRPDYSGTGLHFRRLDRFRGAGRVVISALRHMRMLGSQKSPAQTDQRRITSLPMIDSPWKCLSTHINIITYLPRKFAILGGEVDSVSDRDSW